MAVRNLTELRPNGQRIYRPGELIASKRPALDPPAPAPTIVPAGPPPPPPSAEPDPSLTVSGRKRRILKT